MNQLYNFSVSFKKLSYFPADQEDFQKAKQILETLFKQNNDNLQNILNTLNNINLNKYKSRIRKVKTRKQYENFISDIIMIEIHSWETLIDLNKLIGLDYFEINLSIDYHKSFNLKNFFNIIKIYTSDLTDEQLKSLNLPLFLNEVESTIQILISEFSKVLKLFNSFKPEINYIDPEYIDIDSYITSYLEFFVKVIEEYEDIFKIKEENFEEAIKNLNLTKESLNSAISQLQERTQPDPTEDEIESLYREVEDLNQDPEDPDQDPQVIEEQEELVREFKEKRRNGK